MQKATLEKEQALDLITFSPVVLVTSSYAESSNIITIGWSSPIGFSPPLIAIVVGHGHYSHHLIENSREFAINIPDISLLEEVRMCGASTGRETDKFLDARFNELRPISIKAPLIKECFAHIECQVYRSFSMEDHTIFCGSIAAVLAEQDILSKDGIIDLEKRQPILHLGHNKYFGIGNFL